MSSKIKLAALIALAATIAVGATIKTWTSSEPLTSTDLNVVFQHVHNNLRGAGHTLITDADVSANASFAPAKSTRAYAYVSNGASAPCAAGTCTTTGSLNVTSVTWDGAVGKYKVNLNEAWTLDDIAYVPLVTAVQDDIICTVVNPLRAALPHFDVWCYALSVRGLANAVFTFSVYDDG